MRFHELISAVLILAINVFAKPKYDSEQEIVISNEDRALFNKPEGLWFRDDEGRLVRATMEMPSMYTIDQVNMENSVFFYVYTRNPVGPDALYVDDVHMLQKSSFNASRPTKFITHGWVNSRNSEACVLPREAYLMHGDHNVIVVDWSKITMQPYMWSVSQVKPVAQYIARMIDFLASQGANLDTMTLVGHSLGAHVMGLAGYHAKGTVNYVVGLDPALPMFATATEEQRISIKDARHVEIIHTNAGLLGYMFPIGTADFYPNGGSFQANCPFDWSGYCSHARSYQYFAESLNSNVGFYGRKCTIFEFMAGMCNGQHGIMGTVRFSLPFSGTYYFKTKNANPFANGR